MLFAFHEQPYHVFEASSGLVVARENRVSCSVTPEQVIYNRNTENLTGAVNEYYPYLREWISPVLEESNLSLESVYVEPVDLPETLRKFPNDAQTILVANTFPPYENRFMYTVGGLYLRGDVSDFMLDNLSEPDNHFSCVPTAIRRLGLINDQYFSSWNSDIQNVKSSTDPNRVPEWTGHVIAIKPEKNGGFWIGDQYGQGIISEDVLIEIAETRNSFHGDDPYHLQVFYPNFEIIARPRNWILNRRTKVYS